MGLPSPLPPLLVTAGLIEISGGALITLGLFTRIVAFICSGEMAFAYLTAHLPASFWPGINGGDAAILCCFLFLYLAAAGGGRFELGQAHLRKR